MRLSCSLPCNATPTNSSMCNRTARTSHPLRYPSISPRRRRRTHRQAHLLQPLRLPLYQSCLPCSTRHNARPPLEHQPNFCTHGSCFSAYPSKTRDCCAQTTALCMTFAITLLPMKPCTKHVLSLRLMPDANLFRYFRPSHPSQHCLSTIHYRILRHPPELHHQWAKIIWEISILGESPSAKQTKR